MICGGNNLNKFKWEFFKPNQFYSHVKEKNKTRFDVIVKKFVFNIILIFLGKIQQFE